MASSAAASVAGDRSLARPRGRVGPSSTNVTRAQCLLVAPEERDQLVAVGARRAAVGQLVRRDHRAVLGDPIGVDAAETMGELGGVHETDADGLAVAQVVAAGRLERVSERVAVVQQRAALGFALVVGDDRGLDLDTLARCARRAASAIRSSPVRKWYFAISPAPLRHSRGGSEAEQSVSHSTALGCQ